MQLEPTFDKSLTQRHFQPIFLRGAAIGSLVGFDDRPRVSHSLSEAAHCDSDRTRARSNTARGQDRVCFRVSTPHSHSIVSGPY